MNTIRPMRCFFLALAVVAFACTALPAQAQLASFIRFRDGNGEWMGELTVGSRAGWTSLESVTFGANLEVTESDSGSTTFGKGKFEEVIIRKAVDRLTPQIFASTSSGVPLLGPDADVTIEFERQVNGKPVVFFRLEMKLATLVSTSTTPQDGERLTETVAIRAGALRYTYWPIQPNGTQGTPIVRAWSVVRNNATFDI